MPDESGTRIGKNGRAEFHLPLRRREQLKRVLQGEPIGQASLAVGYKTVKSGSNALADTKQKLLGTMDHYNLTPDTLVRDYLLPLLNATKTELAKFEGKITDSIELADNGTRLSALDMTWKLRGAYPREEAAGPSRLDININNVQVNE